MSLEIRRTRGSSSHRYENIFNVFVFLSFTAITALTAQLFSPLVKTNAEEQTASSTYGPNSISISKEDSVSFNISPSKAQEIYNATDTLTVANTCPRGATVTINTNSNSDTEIANNLYRAGNDDYPKIIKPTTGNNLINSSWGVSTDDGKTYRAVPAKDQTPTTAYSSLSKTINPDIVTIKYGIKTDNHIPPGDYSNDIVYSATVNPMCLDYDVEWVINTFTSASLNFYPWYKTSLNFGEPYDFSAIDLEKQGYTLESWTSSYDGGSVTIPANKTDADPNPTEAQSITLTANWVPTVYHITYELDGGTIENAPTSYTIEGNTELPFPTKPGFVFQGWTYDNYIDPYRYTNVNLQTLGDRTYTAHWVLPMQTFSCSDLGQNEAVTLGDERNLNIYLVKKLADGKCWMTQDLNINNITISSEDSNLPSGTSFTLPASSISNITESNWDTAAVYTTYYNYYTTTAGWGTRSVTSGTAPQDICPKGWRLPTGGSDGEYQTLYNNYNSYSLMTDANGPRFSVNGFISNGRTSSYNALSYYWSSTIKDEYSTYALRMSRSNSTVDPTFDVGKWSGMHIRCIAK